MRRVVCGSCLLLACAASFACGPPIEAVPQPPSPLSSVKPPSGGSAIVRELRSPEEIALRGLRVDGKSGDFVLEGDGLVAVVSRSEGEVVDFGPAGAIDELVSITPAIFDPMGQSKAPIVFIGVDPGQPEVVRIVRRGASLPVRLHTFVTIRDGLLVIESTVEPESPRDAGIAVGVGERFSWGNVPTWVEGTGFVRREGGALRTAFVARDGPGLAYAASVEGTKSLVRFTPAYLAGFFVSGRGSELLFASEPSPSPRRTLLVSASPTSAGDAAARLYAPESMRSFAPPSSLPSGARVEVSTCPEPKQPDPLSVEPTGEPERRPYARFQPAEQVRVPAGCFEARAWAPGFTVTDWLPLERLASLTMAPSGTLVVAVSEQGKPTLARVQVRGVGATASPDWGEDPDDGAALNVAHVRNGSLTRPVPPGRYRVIADRGFEYSAPELVVDVEANQRAYASLQIEQVVDTRGWVSADLHLHASPSPDAPQSLDERVLSLAASGVEVGVATDHNRVIDYAPTIEALGLRGKVASIIGDEVTTEEMPFGHFNVFPLEAGSPALAYKRTSPLAIFGEARSRRPLLGGTLLQVNHPRMGDIGYFDVIRLDRDDIASFTKRTPWAPLDFDAIEVFNGDDAASLGQVRSIMKDWLALIDAGYRSTATGNSDSHRAVFHEPGLPRTYVAVKNESLAPFDQADFVDALQRGRAIVSSGPFLRFDIGGAGIGDVVAPGIRDAHLTVDAPPWMEITYVEILQKGRVGLRIEGPFEAGPHAAEVTTSLDLRPGDWVVAVAGGSKEMDPLFRRGIVPFAFTNPIFVGP